MTGGLERLLSRHCSAVTMERLVDPILTDIRIELANAGRWTGFWIHCAGIAALVKALAVYGWTHFWRFREWPADDRRILIRTLAYSVAVTTAGMLLLTAPVLIRWRALGWEKLPPPVLVRQLASVFAQVGALALPSGLLLGLIYGFRAEVGSLRPRAAVMIAAIVSSIVSLVAVEWVVPETLGELLNRIDEHRRLGLDRSRMLLAYHSRWALATAPIVLTAWALLLHARLAWRGRWLMGIVAIASSVAYYTLMTSGRSAVIRNLLPPMVGGWLPVIVFGAAIILLARRTSNEYELTRTTNGGLSS